ncbi:MAG: DUF6486 family protein [Prevotella sp.]|nr:DUF6486 family protein [Prevotella sp.]
MHRPQRPTGAFLLIATIATAVLTALGTTSCMSV